MSYIDRGIIKWQPFNSCFDANLVMDDINKEKNRTSYPILSEDQLFVIEEKLLTAYELKTIVQIKYYYDGNIKEINGKINSLNQAKKILYINNQEIHFRQILKIIEN